MSIEEAKLLSNKILPGANPLKLKLFAKSLKRVVVLKTLWYDDVISTLEKSAFDYLISMGVKTSAIEVHSIPGSFELPLAAQHYAKAKKRADFIIALGCVIKGATPHFDYVCQSVSSGLMKVSLENRIPIGFGVLTVLNIKQALERATKGQEAAQAAFYLSYKLRND